MNVEATKASATGFIYDGPAILTEARKDLIVFPAPVPEIPAANLNGPAAYYVNNLGFTLDWGGIAGGPPCDSPLH